MRKKFIWFDMDGTLNKFFDIPDWLDYLHKEDVFPFVKAAPKVNPKELRELTKILQQKGYGIGVITYLPPGCSANYAKRVREAKINYLKNVFVGTKFDEIIICMPHIPKDTFGKQGDFLIDDTEENRKRWCHGRAFTEKDLLPKLKRYFVRR